MSTVATHLGLECEPSHVVVVLNPSLSDQQWGDVDAVTQKVVNELLARTSPTCLIDLSQLNYMGSSMVALVVRVWKTVKAQNGRMAVICADEFVLGVLRVAGLDKLWTIVPDRLTAFRQLKIRGQAGPAPALATSLAGAAAVSQPAFTSEDESVGGWGLVIASVVGVALAVGMISASSQLQLDSRAKLGLVIACSCIGAACGAIAFMNRRGLPKVVAGLCAVAALLLGVASVMAKETTWQGIRQIGASAPEPVAVEPEPVVIRAQPDPVSPEEAAAADAERRAKSQAEKKADDPPPASR